MTIIYFSDHKPAIDKQSDVTKSVAKETAVQEDRNSVFNEQFKGVGEEKDRTEVCANIQSLSCQKFTFVSEPLIKCNISTVFTCTFRKAFSIYIGY